MTECEQPIFIKTNTLDAANYTLKKHQSKHTQPFSMIGQIHMRDTAHKGTPVKKDIFEVLGSVSAPAYGWFIEIKNQLSRKTNTATFSNFKHCKSDAATRSKANKSLAHANLVRKVPLVINMPDGTQTVHRKNTFIVNPAYIMPYPDDVDKITYIWEHCQY